MPFWDRKPLRPLAEHGPSTYYLIYGSSEDQPGPYETAPGTDFAALGDGLISATPINYDYADPSRDDNEWTQKLIATAQTYLSN